MKKIVTSFNGSHFIKCNRFNEYLFKLSFQYFFKYYLKKENTFCCYTDSVGKELLYKYIDKNILNNINIIDTNFSNKFNIDISKWQILSSLEDDFIYVENGFFLENMEFIQNSNNNNFHIFLTKKEYVNNKIRDNLYKILKEEKIDNIPQFLQYSYDMSFVCCEKNDILKWHYKLLNQIYDKIHNKVDDENILSKVIPELLFYALYNKKYNIHELRNTDYFTKKIDDENIRFFEDNLHINRNNISIVFFPEKSNQNNIFLQNLINKRKNIKNEIIAVIDHEDTNFSNSIISMEKDLNNKNVKLLHMRKKSFYTNIMKKCLDIAKEDKIAFVMGSSKVPDDYDYIIFENISNNPSSVLCCSYKNKDIIYYGGSIMGDKISPIISIGPQNNDNIEMCPAIYGNLIASSKDIIRETLNSNDMSIVDFSKNIWKRGYSIKCLKNIILER